MEKNVWDRAWFLEDMFWKLEYKLQRCLDLVSSFNSSPRYLTWWALSDKYPETMAQLVCHGSLLWADDFRLKHLPKYAKICPLCDLAALEDVRHLLLQCPSSKQKRRDIFSNLERSSLGVRLFQNAYDMLHVPILLAKYYSIIVCFIDCTFVQNHTKYI